MAGHDGHSKLNDGHEMMVMVVVVVVKGWVADTDGHRQTDRQENERVCLAMQIPSSASNKVLTHYRDTVTHIPNSQSVRQTWRQCTVLLSTAITIIIILSD